MQESKNLMAIKNKISMVRYYYVFGLLDTLTFDQHICYLFQNVLISCNVLIQL